VRAQDDHDRAFDALFEPHGDGYLVFGKRGGAPFSVQERDAYVAAHRKAKLGWKALPIIVAGLVGAALVEFVALNAAVRLWPAIRSSPGLITAIILTVAFAPAVLLIGGISYPTLSVFLRVRREANRRTPVTPPRATPPWTRKLPNWIALLGIIGLGVAQGLGWATLTWPWILAGCGLAGLVLYVVSRPTGK
jgi:hypothetical protein